MSAVVNPTLSILARIRVILFAIFCAAIGHGALIVLLPIDMQRRGIDVSSIGLIMACYSIGMMLGSRFGYKLIQQHGHHRVYSAMAAIVCIVAIAHSFLAYPMFMAVMRVMVGVSMAIIFITLESWLSSIADRNSRSFIFAIYQAFFGLGFLFAPFVATLLPPEDHRSYGLIAMLLSLSLLPLLLSSQTSPKLEGDQKSMSIIEILRDSPTSSIGSLCAGIILGTPLVLLTVFLLNFGLAGLKLALIYGAMHVGSLLFQVPIGRLADRYAKRSIIILLCVGAVLGSTLLIAIVEILVAPSWWILLVPVVILGGCQACIYPLCLTLLFEQVDSDKAVPALGTMLILHTIGLSLGPITASFLMSLYGDNAMLIFVIAIATAFGFFVLYRKHRSRHSVDRESIPYVISLQNIRSVASNLDPRLDNLVFSMNSSGIRTLANSIAVMPHRTMKLLAANQALLDSDPSSSLESLVLLKPRQSYEIISAMVRIYPDKRFEFVDALGDIIVLKKQLINSLMLDGLLYKVDEELAQKIKQRFKDILASADTLQSESTSE